MTAAREVTCDFEGIVTQHPRMRALLALVGRVAEARAPVLITGPTGTGKELVARALHEKSERRKRPFVAVHCAALPSSLLEAELFGHTQGAFSGAGRERAGRVAAARGGTLFLDEVGEIPLEVQAKLLRFLQFGEIQRVGADQVETVEVRVVSATHRDLRALVKKGVFREDLYYRLNVVSLEIPALAERASDIPLLIRYFLERHAAANGRSGLSFAPQAEAALFSYSYPGNVRELSHIVERAVIISTGPVLDLDCLPEELKRTPLSSPVFEEATPTSASLQAARAEAVRSVEEAFLRVLMAEVDWNISRAARRARMHRSYLQKLLARHPEVLALRKPIEGA